MRKLIIFLFYSFFLILLGRNLIFIPQISISGDKKIKDSEEIRNEIISYLKNQKGEYNVCYRDLVKDENFRIRPDTVLTAASLNKLPIVAYLYNLAYRNKIELQETIVIQESDIQDYGTGNLRYEKAGKAYTLQYLAQLALQQSDNTAAHVLSIRLGEGNIQGYAYKIGMNATNMVENETSCRDIETFFTMLYSNKIASNALTQEMIGYMEDTEFEDRLPSLLPKDVRIFHKTGDGINFIHDAGIISKGKKPFILVVTSSNLQGTEGKAKIVIGTVAKMVYEGRGSE